MSPQDKIKDDFLTEDFIMEFTGYSKKSVQTYRSSGSDKIPPHVKIGKEWKYPLKEFNLWCAKRRIIRAIA